MTKRSLLGGAAILALSGCLLFDDDAPRFGALRAAQARWEAAGLDGYAVREVIGCYCLCPRTFVVVVNGETVTDVTDIEPVEGVDPEQLEEFAHACAYTVPKLFLVIASHIDSADRFDVEYDRELGYPTRIAIDPKRQIADEEISIALDDLVPAGALVRVPSAPARPGH